MLKYLAAILLAMAPPLMADDPVPQPILGVTPASPSIIFPVLPIADPLPVKPVTPADPDAVPLLAFGKIYVVQSDTDFFLDAYPEGLVDITPPTAGPITVRGIFADGSGKTETRTFKAGFVAFVDVAEGASGRITLVATPIGVTDHSKLVKQLIDIGVAPQPPPIPPGPNPPPGPTPPPPTPAPTGFRAIFIYETAAKLTREQHNILHSTQITAYLNSHCIKGPDGLAEWRKWTPTIKVTDRESPTIAAMWNAIDKTKIANNLPQLAIAVNGAVTVIPLPATEAETLALLKKAGGE